MSEVTIVLQGAAKVWRVIFQMFACNKKESLWSLHANLVSPVVWKKVMVDSLWWSCIRLPLCVKFLLFLFCNFQSKNLHRAFPEWWRWFRRIWFLIQIKAVPDDVEWWPKILFWLSFSISYKLLQINLFDSIRDIFLFRRTAKIMAKFMGTSAFVAPKTGFSSIVIFNLHFWKKKE